MDKNKQAVNVFNEYARQYQDKYMDVALYQKTLDEFCLHLPVNAAVLELACGPGNITKYLLEKRPDLDILATDFAPNMVRLAAMNNIKARFELMDCRNIRALDKKFHAVMCGFCLPYLSKEESVSLIGDISEILHPGGICYLSTMEDEYCKSGLKKSSDGKSELFMHFHEAEYLAEAMSANKLKILDLHRQEFPSDEP